MKETEEKRDRYGRRMEEEKGEKNQMLPRACKLDNDEKDVCLKRKEEGEDYRRKGQKERKRGMLHGRKQEGRRDDWRSHEDNE